LRAAFRKARFAGDRLETVARFLSSASGRMRFAPRRVVLRDGRVRESSSL
jgi:hypothetical protein